MEEYIREITLPHILKTLKINLRVLSIIIIALSILFIMLFMVNNKRQHKIYKAVGAIEVNNYVPNNNFANQEITSNANSTSLVNANGLATRSEVEEALIDAGYILIPVIHKNQLDISVDQKKSLLDGLISTYCRIVYSNADSAKINPNEKSMASYCDLKTGTLTVSKFDVSPELLNKEFIIKVIDDNNYQLLSNDNILLTGKVGESKSITGLKIQVKSITAGKGREFIVSKNSMDNAIKDLTQEVAVEPVIVGKNFVPPVTGVVKISMIGDRPELQAKVINDIIDELKSTALMQQNTELRGSINFVGTQIQIISAKLAKSQAEMVAFQAKNNIISLDNQERQYVSDQAAIAQSILENTIELNQFSTLYGKKHPLMVDLYTQRDFLLAKQTKIDKELKKLPANEALYVNIKRNLDVYEQLYSFLLNKEQDLKMKLSSFSSPVEILYYASPYIAQVNQNMTARTLAFGLLGMFIMTVIIFLSVVFLTSGDPWLVSTLTQVPLLTIFPFCKMNFKQMMRSVELTTSYILKHTNKTKGNVINFGGITSQSGKTLIIKQLIKSLSILDKKCVYINFGTSEKFQISSKINEQLTNASQNEILGLVEININLVSAMNDIWMLELFSKLNCFDFIFVECPPTEQSTLFLTLSRMVDQSIMIVSAKDNRNKINWLINEINSIKAEINQIIYNNPKYTLIKSIFSIESYNQ